MRIRKILYLTLAALPSMALQAQAADCGQLQMVNNVQMSRSSAEVDIVPLRINGTDQQFILDTGGLTTMINRQSAEKLKLRIVPSYRGVVNVAGGAMFDTAFVDQFDLGRLHGKDLKFPVSPFNAFDGVLSLNFMLPYDVDMDFGSDKLNFFSQDHCPGGVQYWKADAVAVVPFTIDDGHVVISAMLDGQPVRAMLDTGATSSVLRMDVAQQTYKLTMGDEATPETERVLSLDPKAPKFYTHTFKSLAFGDIKTNNLPVGIMEDVWKRDRGRATLVSQRAKSEKDLVALLPELIVGMDVMRKLHIYFAFAERKMYISLASSGGAAAAK
jgi:predicted aspartyl protease